MQSPIRKFLTDEVDDLFLLRLQEGIELRRGHLEAKRREQFGQRLHQRNMLRRPDRAIKVAIVRNDDHRAISRRLLLEALEGKGVGELVLLAVA